MNICAISDLHGYLPKDIPQSDLLLIAGDIAPITRYKPSSMLGWLDTTFRKWCKDQDTYEIVLIAGNHDMALERNKKESLEILNSYGDWFHYLENEYKEITIEGETISIFGTPYCKKFGNWAFMREYNRLKEYYAECPPNVDIVLSHDAPYGVGDVCLDPTISWGGENVGNKALLEMLNITNFKWNIHGHLHSSAHYPIEFKDGKVINVSLLDEQYNPAYEPFFFTI